MKPKETSVPELPTITTQAPTTKAVDPVLPAVDDEDDTYDVEDYDAEELPPKKELTPEQKAKQDKALAAQKDLDASLFANRNPRDGARGGAPGLSKEASNALKGASKLLGGATDQLDRLKGDSAATDAANKALEAIEKVGGALAKGGADLAALPKDVQKLIKDAATALANQKGSATGATRGVLDQLEKALGPLKTQIDKAATKAGEKLDRANAKLDKSLKAGGKVYERLGKLGAGYADKMNNVKTYMAGAKTKFDAIKKPAVKGLVSGANTLLEKAGNLMGKMDKDKTASFDTVDASFKRDLALKHRAMLKQKEELKKQIASETDPDKRNELIADRDTMRDAEEGLKAMQDTVKKAAEQRVEKVKQESKALREQVKSKTTLWTKMGLGKKMGHVQKFTAKAASQVKKLTSEAAKKKMKQVNDALGGVSKWMLSKVDKVDARGKSKFSFVALPKKAYKEMKTAAKEMKAQLKDTRGKIRDAEERGDVLTKRRLMKERKALAKAEEGAKAMRTAVKRARTVASERIDRAATMWTRARDGGGKSRRLGEGSFSTVEDDGVRDELNKVADYFAGDPGRDTRADNDDDDDDKDTDGADDDAGGAEERSGDAVDAVARATKELERCGSFIDTPDEGEGDGKKKMARHAFAEHPITTARCRSGVRPRALEHPARSSDVLYGFVSPGWCSLLLCAQTIL